MFSLLTKPKEKKGEKELSNRMNEHLLLLYIHTYISAYMLVIIAIFAYIIVLFLIIFSTVFPHWKLREVAILRRVCYISILTYNPAQVKDQYYPKF